VLGSAAVADYLDQDTITKFSPLALRGVDETVLTFSIHTDDPDVGGSDTMPLTGS
jgi:class 3 adenylate cyclase